MLFHAYLGQTKFIEAGSLFTLSAGDLVFSFTLIHPWLFIFFRVCIPIKCTQYIQWLKLGRTSSCKNQAKSETCVRCGSLTYLEKHKWSLQPIPALAADVRWWWAISVPLKCWYAWQRHQHRTFHFLSHLNSGPYINFVCKLSQPRTTISNSFQPKSFFSNTAYQGIYFSMYSLFFKIVVGGFFSR